MTSSDADEWLVLHEAIPDDNNQRLITIRARSSNKCVRDSTELCTLELVPESSLYFGRAEITEDLCAVATSGGANSDRWLHF